MPRWEIITTFNTPFEDIEGDGKQEQCVDIKKHIFTPPCAIPWEAVHFETASKYLHTTSWDFHSIKFPEARADTCRGLSRCIARARKRNPRSCIIEAYSSRRLLEPTQLHPSASVFHIVHKAGCSPHLDRISISEANIHALILVDIPLPHMYLRAPAGPIVLDELNSMVPQSRVSVGC